MQHILSSDCGVFGIIDHPQAATYTAIGLHALQHRGQEAAGISTFDGAEFHHRRKRGLVRESFFGEQILVERLLGDSAIGHVRYSTTRCSGHDSKINIQPLFANVYGGIALAHNGNLTNVLSLRKELCALGVAFYTDMDSEVFMPLMARSSKNNILEALSETLCHIEGAYSLVLLGRNVLIGVRDPFGVRPLAIGILDNAYVLASETCAFDSIGAQHVREVMPGEIVFLSKNEAPLSVRFGQPKRQRFCIFEYVYFAKPDSIVEGKAVSSVRKRIGAELAREHSVPADVVVPIPDSGVSHAIGYAEESEIPFSIGIIRSHYIGRTFIEPAQEIRDASAKLKYNVARAEIEGKRVIIVDDSLVRGTTSRKIVSMVRSAGAREIHFRVGSPPIPYSCFYGIDTPKREELLAAHGDIESMCSSIGADSLRFLSIDGLYRALDEEGRDKISPQHCDACFTGEYPIPLVDRDNGL